MTGTLYQFLLINCISYQKTYARHTYTGSNLQVHQIHQFSENKNKYLRRRTRDSLPHSVLLIIQK
jgi:hypothetical protein